MESIGIVLVLRVVHILAGVFWVGATIMSAFFVIPTVRATGPAGGQFVGTLMGKMRLSPALSVAGLLAVLSGGILYSDFYAAAPWDTFGPHVWFGVGGALAVIALVAGLAVGPVTSSRLAALGGRIAVQGTPPTPEQQAERGKLFGRLTVLARFNATMMILATAAMAIARYA